MFLTAKENSCIGSSDSCESSHAETDCDQTEDQTLSSAEASKVIDSSCESTEEIAVMQNAQQETRHQAEDIQVFQEAPPSKAQMTREGGAHVHSVVDWSHDARRKRLLANAGSDIIIFA